MLRIRTAALLAALLVPAALAGCAAPAAPEPAAPAGLVPVIDRDFPDPDLLEVDGAWYAYATNSADANVQVARSDDLLSWEALDDAFPVLPPWVRPGDTWAPEVTRVGDGYRLYFTAANLDPERQCIGVAVADRPEGPFEAAGDGMLVCPDELGGAIDATTFVDEAGTLHLLWKNDGNCCGLPVTIFAAPLTADGLALAGPSMPLIERDLPWEGDVIEAPTLVEHDGSLHLFYSAGSYADDSYSVGHATAAALAGPWTKDPEPLLDSEDTGWVPVGPGGQDVVAAGDGERLAFHGWNPDLTARRLYVVPLTWDGDRPVVRLPG